VKGILEWPVPHNVHEARSFHGIANFYRKFIRGFSGICTPMVECMKVETFQWNAQAQKNFEQLSVTITKSLILALSDFDKIFQIKCDASGVALGAVLSQQNKPITFFNKKLNEVRKMFSKYDSEPYANRQMLKHWSHYLLPREFVLYTEHQELKFMDS